MKTKILILLIGFLLTNSLIAKSQEQTEEVAITTSVVMLAPGSNVTVDKKVAHDYLMTWKNKEFYTITKVDSISLDKTITKLHTYADNLIILVDAEEMRILESKIEDSIINKNLGVRGIVIPYKKKFAIKINDMNQLTIQP